LLEINLKILLRKTGERLNFKIALISLHIDPGSQPDLSKTRHIFRLDMVSNGIY
jgi:hypothetical protein